MSDDGPDDMLPSTSRDRLDASGHRLEFSIGDHVLPYDMTVYQAVQQFGTAPIFDMSHEEPSESNRNSSVVMYGSPGIWARIHTIYYRPVTTGAVGSNSAEAGNLHTGHQGNFAFIIVVCRVGSRFRANENSQISERYSVQIKAAMKQKMPDFDSYLREMPDFGIIWYTVIKCASILQN